MPNKNKKYKRSIEDAGRISDEQYYDIMENLVNSVNNRSNADFVKRLQDENRNYINDWANNNKIATHKLSYATDDKGAIVFPFVQNINGNLYDFTDPKNNRGEWDALDSAIERGDTLRMTPREAEVFTTSYKNYYPKGNTFNRRNKKANGGASYEEYNNTIKSERANAAKAANIRERAIAKHYFNAGPNIVNLAKAAYYLWNGIPHFGGQDESGNVFNTGIAPTPGFKKDALVEAAKKNRYIKRSKNG